MVSTNTQNSVNWPLLRGRLAIAALATVGAISLLGAVHDWPPGSGQPILVSLVLSELGLAVWCSFAARGVAAVVCFVVAIVVLVTAVVGGIVGFFEVACWTGHCISFD